jgi:murein DD-endopeptidase MepM/ murein hydrolase activator NlpD
MRERLSFFILSHTGAPVRQVSAPKWALQAGALLALVMALLGAVGLYDYLRLKAVTPRARELNRTIARQSEEIADQQHHIQRFGEELNTLKGRLAALVDFEHKIRVIANLDRPNQKGNGFFGIGGALPPDLNTRLPLKEHPGRLLRQMHTQADRLGQAAGEQERSMAILLERLETQVSLLAAKPAIAPVEGWVSSAFGKRTSPFTGKEEFHSGLDISAESGTPICASADGLVTAGGSDGALGLTAVVDHGHGLVTRYGHCEKLIAAVGRRVKRGETIAQVGSSGRSTGPHVHYEVLLNGVPVNPRNYILD